jgi:hypothetical protein
MAKNSRDKKKGKKQKMHRKSTEQKPAVDESENPLDFGGMPARDLKKNLGCG